LGNEEKRMPDYSKGKIYTIRCKNDSSLIYVGSTIQPLAKRWGLHKCDSLKKPEQLIYKTINNDWDNWYIELYQNCPCNSKEELLKREGEIIREIGNLNQRIEGIKRKENQNEYNKEYYEKNKEKLYEKQKKYRDNNREKLNEISRKYSKKYRENNKEKCKEYYEENKEKINEYKKEKYYCNCGGCYTNAGKSIHLKTKIHQNYLASIES